MYVVVTTAELVCDYVPKMVLNLSKYRSIANISCERSLAGIIILRQLKKRVRKHVLTILTSGSFPGKSRPLDVGVNLKVQGLTQK